ncbi:MAG TPA: radical SAM family heme chaperone HemW [Clostridiales bacterium]|nr:radical SAM family heme chaperone HemW [Clostridiales bacterium]
MYIHVPFCTSKCGYCDFYSVAPNPNLIGSYTGAVCSELSRWSHLNKAADTLYFGGGTPTLLGGKNIEKIINTAKTHFGLEKAEITLEANPCGDLEEILKTAASCGVNRLSLGVQSGVSGELKALTRRHTPEDVLNAIGTARKAGIKNISADIMLGIPRQTPQSLEKTLQFVTGLNIRHISAYMLKIEPGTPFYSANISLPDENEAAELYLNTVKLLESAGFCQYEISNFAIPGFESKHNLKYWNCEEYLGIGPAAHSFISGQRFYYERNLEKFLKSPQTIPDGEGGSPDEYAVLRLRLKDGLVFSLFRERFSRDVSERFLNQAEALEGSGLIVLDSQKIALTPEGFLVSNRIITHLLEYGI